MKEYFFFASALNEGVSMSNEGIFFCGALDVSVSNFAFFLAKAKRREWTKGTGHRWLRGRLVSPSLPGPQVSSTRHLISCHSLKASIEVHFHRWS